MGRVLHDGRVGLRFREVDDLHQLLAWVCLAIGTVAAVLASSGGLFGILCGVGSAWVLFAAGGTWLAVISFRRRFNAATTAGEHRTLE